mmetsp:Transcript_19540/g.52675  ORF Transcript_19540/g.52675 Transcript_19540/m.52675 type:complete len:250 (+) Transcript_19540:850-1599(+)
MSWSRSQCSPCAPTSSTRPWRPSSSPPWKQRCRTVRWSSSSAPSLRRQWRARRRLADTCAGRSSHPLFATIWGEGARGFSRTLACATRTSRSLPSLRMLTRAVCTCAIRCLIPRQLPPLRSKAREVDRLKINSRLHHLRELPTWFCGSIGVGQRSCGLSALTPPPQWHSGDTPQSHLLRLRKPLRDEYCFLICLAGGRTWTMARRARAAGAALRAYVRRTFVISYCAAAALGGAIAASRLMRTRSELIM